jgi:hypothetical protein
MPQPVARQQPINRRRSAGKHCRIFSRTHCFPTPQLLAQAANQLATCILPRQIGMVRLRNIFHCISLLAPMLASIHGNCTNVSYRVKRDSEEKQKTGKNRRSIRAEALKRCKNRYSVCYPLAVRPEPTAEGRFRF